MSITRKIALSWCIAGLLIPAISHAAGFAARVSPPRFELEAQPGDIIRDHLVIVNGDTTFGTYDIRTADWDLDERGGVIIHDQELTAGSCRPWTRLERRRLKLAPDAEKKFRFEIRVPDDAKQGECRFAILISATGDSLAPMKLSENIDLPIVGRIAIIFYVAIDGAKPKLEIEDIVIQESGGKLLPMAIFYNAGNAHGRPFGVLEGKDASDQYIELHIVPSPILPGSRRAFPLVPVNPDGTDFQVEIAPPFRLKGLIEWKGGSYRLDTTVR